MRGWKNHARIIQASLNRAGRRFGQGMIGVSALISQEAAAEQETIG